MTTATATSMMQPMTTEEMEQVDGGWMLLAACVLGGCAAVAGLIAYGYVAITS